MKIPLPPYGEQHRIITRIEELITKVDEARQLGTQATAGTKALTTSAAAHILDKLVPSTPNAKNVLLRYRQFVSAGYESTALSIARKLIAGKIRNQRTLLQRNHIEAPETVLRQLKLLAEKAETALRAEVHHR